MELTMNVLNEKETKNYINYYNNLMQYFYKKKIYY